MSAPGHGPVHRAGGCALDNAAAEAFKRHTQGRLRAPPSLTRAEARLKIATWIADFYNTTRRHSANDGLPPTKFERHMIEKRQASSTLLRTAVA
ncbi:integrase core domain-containing protein [Microbispora bryophytorum]|uniref:integrase core domain-containing protein n=1 Tax=Microbispora bryophytorum TaxID=1460882 RepID=UPI00371B3975